MKIKKLLRNPWVVLVLVVVALCVVVKMGRNYALSRIADTFSTENYQTAYESVNESPFTWKGLGFSFLVDGLSGSVDYLKGNKNAVLQYLQNQAVK